METRLVDPALVRAASRPNSGEEAGRSSASALLLGDPTVDTRLVDSGLVHDAW